MDGDGVHNLYDCHPMNRYLAADWDRDGFCDYLEENIDEIPPPNPCEATCSAVKARYGNDFDFARCIFLCTHLDNCIYGMENGTHMGDEETDCVNGCCFCGGIREMTHQVIITLGPILRLISAGVLAHTRILLRA